MDWLAVRLFVRLALGRTRRLNHSVLLISRLSLGQRLAWLAPVAIGIVLFSLFVVGLTGPEGEFLQDFVEYWSAGRLIAQGENPYDPDKLAEVQYPERPALPDHGKINLDAEIGFKDFPQGT